MSNSSTKIGFFKNKNSAGTGTAHVPVATIVNETLSNAFIYPEYMTYNMAFSTNFAPNTTIGYTITGTATASEFYGGLSGTTTLDANANGNLSITTNVNPSATSGSTKTFAVNLTTTSYDRTFATSNTHNLTGTPGYAIEFVPQGSYATEISTVNISGTDYNLQRMDYTNGDVISSSTDPRGFTENTIRKQQYEITSNQNPAPLEVLVIGGGGSAAYGYNARDPAAGGGGAQIIESSANVIVNTVYDFEVGSNGRYTWLFDNGGDSSYAYWSGGPPGQKSTAFANSSYSLQAREGQGVYGQSGRGGANGGPGWAAGGGGGAGNIFGGNTGPGIPVGGPFPGIGGTRYGQANTAPTATANATMTQGGSGDDGNSSNFIGTTTFYGAGGAGSGDGSANNGTNGNGIDNYGSGGHAFQEGTGYVTITDSKPGTIYIKHLANGDRRIILN